MSDTPATMPSQPLHVAFVCPLGQTPATWTAAAPRLGWQLLPFRPAELQECAANEGGVAAVVFCRGEACGERSLCRERGRDLYAPSIEEVRALVGDRPLIVLESDRNPLAMTRATLRGATLSLPASLPAEELAEILVQAQSSPWISPPFRLATAQGEEDPLPALVGRSPAMREVKTLIRRWAALDRPGTIPLPVLLYGETGTGKGLVARTLHDLGGHREGPFVSVACRGRGAHELEAELFGAPGGRRSAIERARGGVLFLDEILALAPSTQARLVRLLEERAHQRAEGLHDPAQDFRLIAASNGDVARAIAAGRFRADLFHRVECLTLHLPPLRERGDDVLLLARHFLRRLAEEHGGRPPALSSSAVRALRHYPWPGNVRELRNAVTRAAARTTGAVIEAADLGLTRPTPEGDGRRAANGTAAPRPHASPVQLLRSRRLVVDFNLVDRIDLEGLKRDLIRQAIEASGGNQTEAARRLGLSRNAIRYAVKKYGLAATS